MVYPRIKLGFSSYTDSKLIELGRNVVFSITKNEKMFVPVVIEGKDKLKISFERFRELADQANSRDKMAIQARNEYYPTYLKDIESLANLLNTLYAGNGEILEASGFYVMNSKTSRNLTEIESIIGSNGANKGNVDIRITGAKNYHSFLVEYTTDDKITPDTRWVYEVYTRKKITLGKFEFGDKVTIRVTAIGRDDQRSNPKIIRWAVT